MNEAPSRLRVAWVRRAHGTAGELALELLGGPPERLRAGLAVQTGLGERHLTSVRAVADGVLARLEGVETREAAQRLVGTYLEVDRAAARSLPPGEYFHFQLVGLAVVDEDGQPVGELSDVEAYPHHDVYVVRTPVGEARLPAVRDVVRAVDLDQGRMVVRRQALEPADAH
ncbi:MAG TPA: ribosome maturation factor RimM [Candidatus Dormibacteraeota bacterium]|nr:ribosome maturation factor RimM [Candidatus Dormibacteraeota bacterium]